MLMSNESHYKLAAMYAKESGILADFMDAMFSQGKLTKSTAYNYYMQLRGLAKFLKKQRLHLPCDPDEVIMSHVTAEEMSSVTYEEWEAFLNYRRFECSETRGSMAARISCVKSFYYWLHETYSIQTPLCISNAKRPYIKPVQGDFKYVSDMMEIRICEKLRGPEHLVLRNTCIIRLFLHCGIGLDELADLTMSDISMNSIAIRGTTPREIALDEVIKEAIDAYLPSRIPSTDGRNSLFVSEKKKGKLRRGAIEKMLRKALRDAGLTSTGITIRDLQMTGRRRLIDAYGIETAAALSRVQTQRHFRLRYSQTIRNG